MEAHVTGSQGRLRLLFLAVLLGGFALDIWTKGWAFELVPDIHFSPKVVVIEGVLNIVHVENPGAMWSLFQDLPPTFWVVVRSTVFVVLALFYLLRVRAGWWVHVAFGLVLAGACGNVYDNMFSPGGRVRDWIQVILPGGKEFPTFNVADSMITVGAGLLLIYFYRADREARSGSKA
jgi:signal peptidase II